MCDIIDLLHHVAQVWLYGPIILLRLQEAREELLGRPPRRHDHRVAEEGRAEPLRPVRVAPNVEHGAVLAQLLRVRQKRVIRRLEADVEIFHVADNSVQHIRVLLSHLVGEQSTIIQIVACSLACGPTTGAVLRALIMSPSTEGGFVNGGRRLIARVMRLHKIIPPHNRAVHVRLCSVESAGAPHGKWDSDRRERRMVHDSDDRLVLVILADVLNSIVQTKRDVNIDRVIQSRHDLIEDKAQLRSPSGITRKVSTDLPPSPLFDVHNTVDIWSRLVRAVFLLRARGDPVIFHIWQVALDDIEIGVDPVEDFLVAGPQVQRDPPGYHLFRRARILVTPTCQVLIDQGQIGRTEIMIISRTQLLHRVGIARDR
mmetsp:Transcript_61056/g.158483  ORF Transcript_61056/g.158483 Transcript_61056/m.158483 type:complete len:371 (+) Transcript_61056:490-1602(+)